MSASENRPTLWEIPMSHYSEKARWALDFKGVSYRSVKPPPGAHMAVAAALTRGRGVTFPILRINGTTFGDSSSIIAELERLHPQPPLYPDDAAEKARALELEEYFDENLGPAIRRFGWHHLTQNPELVGKAVAEDLPPALAGNDMARSGAVRFASGFVRLRYGAGGADGAEQARLKVIESLDRLEAELAKGDGEFLVGERFSVADLTAASLFYPLVAPPEGPRRVERPPASEEFRSSQSERPGFEWVERTFAHHRRP